MRRKRATGLGGGGGFGILNNSRPLSAAHGFGQNKKVRFQNLDLKTHDNQGQQLEVNRDFEEGTGTNMDIKFKSKGGRETKQLEIYRDIDELNK